MIQHYRIIGKRRTKVWQLEASFLFNIIKCKISTAFIVSQMFIRTSNQWIATNYDNLYI